jgi:hypothetical protein
MENTRRKMQSSGQSNLCLLSACSGGNSIKLKRLNRKVRLFITPSLFFTCLKIFFIFPNIFRMLEVRNFLIYSGCTSCIFNMWKSAVVVTVF